MSARVVTEVITWYMAEQTMPTQSHEYEINIPILVQEPNGNVCYAEYNIESGNCWSGCRKISMLAWAYMPEGLNIISGGAKEKQ